MSTNKVMFAFVLLLFLLSTEVSIFDFESTTIYFQLFVHQVSCVLIPLIPPLCCQCHSAPDLLCWESFGRVFGVVSSIFFALLLHLI